MLYPVRSVVSCLLGLRVMLASPATAEWQTTIVETIANEATTTQHSLALDGQGEPHVTWLDHSQRVFYSHRNGGGWSPAVPVSDVDVIASSPSIAIPRGGSDPFVIYQQTSLASSVPELVLARWNGAGFDTEPLVADGSPIYDPVLEVDDQHAYHVVFVTQVETVWRMRYLTDRWSPPLDELVEAGPLTGPGTGPALDVSGSTVHITYRSRGPGSEFRIGYVSNPLWGHSEWTWETLITPNLDDFGADVDVDGDVHIIVYGNDCWGCTMRPYYLRRLQLNGAWLPPREIVHSAGLSSPSMAGPSAAFAEVGGNIFTGRIMFATRDDDWEEIELTIGSDHMTPSLAIGFGEFGFDGHLVCTTGPNTGVNDVVYARAENLIVDIDPSPGTPSAFLRARPNPFGTSVQFERSVGGPLTLYDVSGRLVRRLAGSTSEVAWDGRDELGLGVAAGVYIARQGDREIRVVKLR